MPTRKTTKNDEPKDDAGEAEVQKVIDDEQEQGFIGTEVDQTPNENYTLQGQVKGLPTPETDADTKAQAQG